MMLTFSGILYISIKLSIGSVDVNAPQHTQEVIVKNPAICGELIFPWEGSGFVSQSLYFERHTEEQMKIGITELFGPDDFVRGCRWPLVKKASDEFELMGIGKVKQTRKNDRRAMLRFRTFLTEKKLKITPDSASNYCEWATTQRSTSASVNGIIQPVKQWLQHLYESRAINWNPKVFMKTRKVDSESNRRPMSVDEACALLEATADPVTVEECQDSLLVRLLLQTGLRASPTARIRIRDVQNVGEDTICMILGKGRHEKDRMTVFPQEVVEAKDRFLAARGSYKPDDFLVYAGKCSYSWLRDRVNFITEKVLGRRVTPHVFRHTFASTGVDCGVPILRIKDAMHHKDVTTTQIYVHTSDRIKFAAEKFVKYTRPGTNSGSFSAGARDQYCGICNTAHAGTVREIDGIRYWRCGECGSLIPESRLRAA